MNGIWGLPLESLGDDIIAISGTLYCKTPESKARVLAALQTVGYEIHDAHDANDHYSPLHEHPERTADALDKAGHSRYFASLDTRRCKCDFCHSIIPTVGSRSHGFKCPVCNKTLYREICRGSSVRFQLKNEQSERVMFAPEFNMEVYRYDPAHGYVYFLPEFLEGGGMCNVHGEDAQKLFDASPELWTKVHLWGKDLIRVRYNARAGYVKDTAKDTITVRDHYTRYSKVRSVRVFSGQEFPEWGDFPVPEMLHINETWHWAPRENSPEMFSLLLHTIGMTADPSYWYQDGRRVYDSGHWTRIGLFVRHFTTLDADDYDRSWPRFRNDGPGGIRDLASWCAGRPIEVKDTPNIGNALIAMSKLGSGQTLTNDEARTANLALEDRENMSVVTQLIDGLLHRKR